MIKNVIILALNDLAVTIKNKSIWLAIFIPLFAVISLKLADHPGAGSGKLRVGFISNENYPRAVLESILSAGRLFTVRKVTYEEGKQQLKEKKLDGIFLRNKLDPDSLELLVLRKDSPQALAIVSNLSALQKAASGIRNNWVSGIKPVQEYNAQTQALPTWILMSVLLVSCIILPSQVAEEKEKKLLLGILQAPVREIEWLAAKLALGLVLSCAAVAALYAASGTNPLSAGPGYIIFIFAGSLCFSSFGIMLGFLCRNQSGARTLGFMFYVPLLVPSALSDFSVSLAKIARYMPTSWFYSPVRSMLLENGRLPGFSFNMIYLASFGLFAFVFSWYLLKRRWLMQ